MTTTDQLPPLHTTSGDGDRDTSAEVIADLAVAATEPWRLPDDDGVHLLTVPPGSSAIAVDMRRYRPVLERPKGTYELLTAASLGRYIAEHKTDATQIYANPGAGSIVAILNDHGRTDEGAFTDEHGELAALANWRDHRATLTLALTDEWQRWATRSGKMMSQTDFAELLEDGTDEIVRPAAADMLELAQTFQAKTDVSFRSVQVLASGERQLTYSEDTTAAAGRAGDILIPKSFTLGLRPYDGAGPFQIDARLRYRIGNGNLSLGFILDRPDLVLRAAFDEAVDEVGAAAGVEAFHGKAPA